VQEPGSAYVMGWAGRKSDENWVFTSAPATGVEKRRASDFDSMPSLLPSAPTGSGETDPDKPADANPGETSGDQPPAPEAPTNPDGPIRKRTPNGPVDIPRKGPGGG